MLLINYDLFIIIISILTYLFLNYKEKTFLGDSGTYLISYIISIFFIKYYNSDKLFLCDEIFMLMILPGLELIRLFIIRIYGRKNPLMPDRNHIHHLISSKFKNIGHVKVSLMNNFFFLLFCLLFFLYPSLIIILLSFIFYVCAIYYLKKID